MAIVCAIVFIPVASEYFIILAATLGLYNDPIGTAEAVLSFLHNLAAHPAFPWTAGIILGLTVGIWLDALIRKADERAPLVPTKSGLGEIDERIEAPPPLTVSDDLSPQIKQLLNNIARLYDNLENSGEDEFEDIWEDIRDYGETRSMFMELEFAKTNLFYNKPLSNALDDLIEDFKKAIDLRTKADKSEEFQAVLASANQKAMALAHMVGAPVRHLPNEAPDSQ